MCTTETQRKVPQYLKLRQDGRSRNFFVRLVPSKAVKLLTGAKEWRGHLHAQPVTGIAVLRMMFQTLPALNVALAMSGVKFRQYLAGTLLG